MRNIAKNEVKITFKAFNKEFNAAVKDMNAEAKKLRQELKLQQEQMKLTGSSTDKLKSQLNSLEKQYAVAQKRTQATAEQLEKVKRKWGDNSNEAARLETQLRRNQITEQQLANKIAETSTQLNEAEQAEKDRLSESARAAQKLDELKNKEDQLKGSTEKLNAEYELHKAQLGENAKESDKLKLKIDHLNKSHELAKAQVKNYEEQLEQAKKKYGENSSEVDKYETQLLEAKTAEQQLANEIKSTNLALKDQESVTKKVSQKLKDTSQRLKDVGGRMTSMGKDLSTKVTAPLMAVAAGLVTTGIGYKAFKEESKQAFSVLLNSAEEAEKHMDRIMAFAKTTPFAFPDLVSANRKLVSFGMEAKKTEPVMEAIANSVAAMGGGGQEIQELADVFAKITANGKITGEELNRLGDKGINALKILANQAKVSMEDMRKKISDGAIDSEKAINWLVDGMMNGTKGVNGATVAMGGSLKSLEGTWKGALDSMKGAWRRAGDEIISDQLFDKIKGSVSKLTSFITQLPTMLGPTVDHMSDIFMSLIDKLSDVADWFMNLKPKTQATIASFIALAAAAGPVLVVSGTLVSSIGTLVGAFGMLTGPVGLTVAGLAALAAGAAYTAKELSKPAVEADVFGNKVSSATERAVGAFLDLERKASNSLKQLSWSGQAVSKEMADEIVDNFSAMKDAVVNKLEEQKKESLASLQELFAGSKDMSDKEKQHLLETTQKSFDDRIKVTEEGHARIEEITKKAVEEKRETTQKEMDEINKIQQEMVETGIMILSESEADQLVIMERLKTESSKISAEQAAEVVKNSIEQRDKTIQAAEEAYNDQIKTAIMLKEEGTEEHKKLADDVIAEATRQRDETVAQAEGMHADVVAEAQAQAGEHVEVIDWYTGEIMSKYEVMTKDIGVQTALLTINTTRELKTMAFNGIKSFQELKSGTASELVELYQKSTHTLESTRRVADKKLKTLASSGLKSFQDLRRGTASELVGMYQKTNITFENTRRAAVRKFVEIQNAIIKPIKVAKAAVETALDQLKAKFDNLKLKIPTPSLPKLPKFSLATNSKTVMGKSITYPTGFNVNWNAKGGIFTKPTIFNTANAGLQGVGEAGPEAIIPLKDSVLGKIGEMIANTMTTNNHNSIVIYATVRNDQDIDKLANKIDGKLNTVGDRRNAAWGG